MGGSSWWSPSLSEDEAGAVSAVSLQLRVSAHSALHMGVTSRIVPLLVHGKGGQALLLELQRSFGLPPAKGWAGHFGTSGCSGTCVTLKLRRGDQPKAFVLLIKPCIFAFFGGVA